MTDFAQQCETNMLAYIEATPDLSQWLAEYTPPGDSGFRFAEHANLIRISRMVESDGHSSVSFAGCIHMVQIKLRRMNRCWTCMACKGIPAAKPRCAYWHPV